MNIYVFFIAGFMSFHYDSTVHMDSEATRQPSCRRDIDHIAVYTTEHRRYQSHEIQTRRLNRSTDILNRSQYPI